MGLILASLPIALWAEPSKGALVNEVMGILNESHLPKLALPTTPPAPAASPLPTQPASQTVTQIPAHPSTQTIAVSGQVEIAKNFLPIYPLEKGSEDMPAQLLPFFSSEQLLTPHAGMDTLVIMLPDETREAARAYAYARAAQEAASRSNPHAQADKAFLFVPQFLLGEDIAAQSGAFPDGGKALLRWSVMEPYAGWIIGQESSSDFVAGRVGGAPHLSSFAVMDYLLLVLTDKNIFPDLKTVVLAGTGTGAVFVQLYAALGQGTDLLASEGLDMRFVAALAPSYLYVDTQRAALVPSAIYHSAGNPPAFVQMRGENTGLPACIVFNDYPFGLDQRPLYSQKQGADEIRLRYAVRKITYLAAGMAQDMLMNTTPLACALTQQGPSLVARASTYFAYLQKIYGDDINRTQKLVIIPGVPPDPLVLWQSPEGQNALFSND